MSISKENIVGLIAILTGIYIFKASTYISTVENVLKEHPVIVMTVMIILFFYRKKIADMVSGNGK